MRYKIYQLYQLICFIKYIVGYHYHGCLPQQRLEPVTLPIETITEIECPKQYAKSHGY